MTNKIISRRKVTSTIFSLLILIVAGFTIFSLQRPQHSFSQKDIQDLDVAYSDIKNRQAEYSLRIIPFDSGTTEGGELKVFFENNDGSTKILEASYAGETFQIKSNYYFEDINKFVLIEKYERWDRPFYAEGRIKTLDKVNKYYFINLGMIGWTDSQGKFADSSSAEFKAKEKEILNRLNELTDLVSKTPQ